MVRIKGSSAAAVAAIRKLCASAADGTGCEPTTLREVSAIQRFPFEAAAAISGALGIMALALTAIGLYSVTSYGVVHRRREIGVHLALGASPVQVTRRLLREAGRCVIAGLACGLPICLILSRLLNSSVFGIRAFDARVYAVAPALLTLFTALACALPARRAARMDPMASLREE
jgi:ABC-type antimicrobial peptide transport system permease subunit